MSVPNQNHIYLNEPNCESIEALSFSSSDIIKPPLPLLGWIPWNRFLISLNMEDVKTNLNAMLVYEKGDLSGRVLRVLIATGLAAHYSEQLKAGTLVVCSGDREDIFLLAANAASNGVPLAGVLFTDGVEPDPNLQKSVSKKFPLKHPCFKNRVSIL